MTWKFDRPVVFLGEWCRLDKRKHIWKNMDAIIAKPYGIENKKKDSDFREIKYLENRLFPEICNLLNNNHKTNHS